MAIIQLGGTQTDRKSWYLGWLRHPSEIFNQQIKIYHLSDECLQIGRMEHINKHASRQQYKYWYVQNVGYYSPEGRGGQGPPHQRTVSFGGPRAEGQPAGGTTWLWSARGEEWFIRLRSHQTTFLWLRVTRWVAWRGRDRRPPPMETWHPDQRTNGLTGHLLLCVCSAHLTIHS